MISLIPKKTDRKMKLHFLDLGLLGLIASKSLNLLECFLSICHLM